MLGSMTSRRGFLAAAALAACLAIPSRAQSDRPAAPPPSTAAAFGLSHVELVTGNAPADAMLPMVVVLHGLGDRPESFVQLFRDLPVPVRVIALRAPIAWGGGGSWFRFAPGGDRNDAGFGDGVARMAEMIRGVTRALALTRPTCGAPLVTGFSQGGMLAFSIAARFRDTFAAAFPVAGLLPGAITPARAPRGGIPYRVLAFHGSRDERVPFADARRSVARLRSAGLDARLQAFPGLGHTIDAQVRTALFEALARSLPARCDTPWSP